MTTTTLETIWRHPLARPLAACAKAVDCHAVGGTVRDALMNRETRDLDASVSEGGRLLAETLADAVDGTAVALGGDRFSSFRVIAGDYQADIWDRRGGSLLADLERRDLTVNSIACDLAGSPDDRVEDPFGGLSDLRDRRLRATGLDCFDRDPLRVLRLARFELTFDDFTVEADTRDAARTACPALSRVARERVRDELTRILSDFPALGAFCALERLGAMDELFAGVSAEGSRALLERAGRLDRELELLRQVLPDVGWTPDDRLHGATALLAAGSSEGPAAIIADLAGRGLLSRRAVRSALRLAAAEPPRNEDDRRLFLAEQGSGWPLALALALALAQDTAPSQPAALARELDRTLRANPGLEGRPVPLLDGNQAAHILSLEPGPALGAALRALARAQVLGRVTSPAEAEEFLRRWPGTSEARATSTSPPDAD